MGGEGGSIRGNRNQKTRRGGGFRGFEEGRTQTLDNYGKEHRPGGLRKSEVKEEGQ